LFRQEQSVNLTTRDPDTRNTDSLVAANTPADGLPHLNPFFWYASRGVNDTTVHRALQGNSSGLLILSPILTLLHETDHSPGPEISPDPRSGPQNTRPRSGDNGANNNGVPVFEVNTVRDLDRNLAQLPGYTARSDDYRTPLNPGSIAVMGPPDYAATTDWSARLAHNYQGNTRLEQLHAMMTLRQGRQALPFILVPSQRQLIHGIIGNR
jgi:hypothetical protein